MLFGRSAMVTTTAPPFRKGSGSRSPVELPLLVRAEPRRVEPVARIRRSGPDQRLAWQCHIVRGALDQSTCSATSGRIAAVERIHPPTLPETPGSWFRGGRVGILETERRRLPKHASSCLAPRLVELLVPVP